MFSDSPESESLQSEREMWEDIARTDRTTLLYLRPGAACPTATAGCLPMNLQVAGRRGAVEGESCSSS